MQDFQNYLTAKLIVIGMEEVGYEIRRIIPDFQKRVMMLK
jgi:hypothetical protein